MGYNAAYSELRGGTRNHGSVTDKQTKTLNVLAASAAGEIRAQPNLAW